MKTKLGIFTILIVAIVAFSLLAGVVYAHEGSPGRGRSSEREPTLLMQAIMDATGLTQEEIRAQWRAGASLAEIIEANGGDVDEVVEQVLSGWEERFSGGFKDDAALQKFLDRMEERLRRRLNRSRSRSRS